MERPRLAVASAVVLLVGWGLMLAMPLASADEVRWTARVSWHVRCETMVEPVLGPQRCVTEIGALGAGAALVGLAAGVLGLLAVRSGSHARLALARRFAVAAGGVLVGALAVGIAKNFAGLAEIPFDLAVLAFALLPVQGLAAAAPAPTPAAAAGRAVPAAP